MELIFPTKKKRAISLIFVFWHFSHRAPVRLEIIFRFSRRIPFSVYIQWLRFYFCAITHPINKELINFTLFLFIVVVVLSILSKSKLYFLSVQTFFLGRCFLLVSNTNNFFPIVLLKLKHKNPRRHCVQNLCVTEDWITNKYIVSTVQCIL